MVTRLICLDRVDCQHIEIWNGKEYTETYSLPFVKCPECNGIAIVTNNLEEILPILKLINEGFYD